MLLQRGPPAPADSSDSTASAAGRRSFAPVVRFAHHAALALLLLVLARAARGLLVPVMVAALLALLCAPALPRLGARGVPAWAGTMLLALLPAALALAALALGFDAAGPWLRDGTGLGRARETGAALLADASAWPGPVGMLAAWLRERMAGFDAAAVLRAAALDAAWTLAQSAWLLFFALLSLQPAARRLRRVLGPRGALRRLALAHRVRRGVLAYLRVMLTMNAALGVATGLALAALGVASAASWGGIVALLTCVPYLGPLASVGLLAAVGAATFGATPWMAAPPAAFLALHVLEGAFVTPWLTARSLRTERVAVLLAVLAGAWAWGVVGGLLAVPLLIAARAALRPARHPVAAVLLDVGEGQCAAAGDSSRRRSPAVVHGESPAHAGRGEGRDPDPRRGPDTGHVDCPGLAGDPPPCASPTSPRPIRPRSTASR
jgi:predicted PurR-regulated permease PerM